MGRKVTWKLKSDVVELGCVMRLSYEQPTDWCFSYESVTFRIFFYTVG